VAICRTSTPDVTQFVTFQLYEFVSCYTPNEFEAILKEPNDSAKRKNSSVAGQAMVVLGFAVATWRNSSKQFYEKPTDTITGCKRGYHAKSRSSGCGCWNVPLVKLIDHWKGKSARLANARLHRSGKFLAGGLL